MNYDREAAAKLFAEPVPRSPLPPNRPTTVVLSILVVAVWGSIEGVAGGLGLLASFVSPPPDPGEIGPIGWMFRNFRLVAGGQMLLGIVTLACATVAWRGRDWARRGCQMVMSLWVLLILALGVVMSLSVTALPGSGVLYSTISTMWRASAIASSLSWALFVGAPAWLLARADARQWFSLRP
jgi:hypothetical protein